MPKRPIDEIRTAEGTGLAGWSDSEREAVLAEMGSILSDPVFKRSQRCTTLLHSMIEHALNGDREGVKERTLGIEVFGRASDYDSNADPIVRMAANEIRKRLAQYYQDGSRHHKVVIRLVPGTYIPEFAFPKLEASEQLHDTAAVERSNIHALSQSGAIEPVTGKTSWKLGAFAASHRRALSGVFLLLGLAALLVLGYAKLFPSAQYLVWKPMMQSKEPLIICVADNTALQKKSDGRLTNQEIQLELQKLANMIDARKAPAISDPANFDQTTPFVDANVAHEITTWLANHYQPTLLRPASNLALHDFHNQPLVLIGGFDNPWTVVLLSDMRFSPRVDPSSSSFWIRDAQNSTKRDWTRRVLDGGQPTVDYAVVTRFQDAETGNWVMGIAGMGPHGTEAASQLLINPEFAELIPRSILSAENFQIVIRTEVINGNTGPPHIEASYTW